MVSERITHHQMASRYLAIFENREVTRCGFLRIFVKLKVSYQSIIYICFLPSDELLQPEKCFRIDCGGTTLRFCVFKRL